VEKCVKNKPRATELKPKKHLKNAEDTEKCLTKHPLAAQAARSWGTI
jgi:hypothetical protein